MITVVNPFGSARWPQTSRWVDDGATEAAQEAKKRVAEQARSRRKSMSIGEPIADCPAGESSGFHFLALSCHRPFLTLGGIPAISWPLKIIYMIPPAAALVFMGAWNLLHVRSIATLESERRVLEKRIAAALVRRTVDSGSRANGVGSHHLVVMRKGGTKEKLPFEEQAAGMMTDELIAALDEIAGMDLSAGERERLESMIAENLIDEDPQLALERFADRISSPGSDAVLVAFLQSYSARSNLDEARHLAGGVQDNKIRGEILKQLK